MKDPTASAEEEEMAVLIDEEEDGQDTNMNESSNGVAPLPFDLHNPASCTFTFQSMDNNINIQHYLSNLQDEHSTYMDVAKACHFLNQFCTHGSYNATPSTSTSTSHNCTHQGSVPTSAPNILNSSILHIDQYAHDTSQILSILSNTSSQHHDRRCRILALQSLCLISHATLLKLSNLMQTAYNHHHCDDNGDGDGDDNGTNGGTDGGNEYYDNIHGSIARVQDEICNDVIFNIILNHCILEEDDDGIVSIAMENLIRFIIIGHDDTYADTDTDTSTHELTKEIRYLQCKFIHKRRRHCDYEKGGVSDSGTYRTVLQTRILQHLTMKIRKILVRVNLIKDEQYKIKCCITLNEIMMFAYQTESHRRMDNAMSNNNIIVNHTTRTRDDDNNNNIDDNDDDDNNTTNVQKNALGKNGFAKRWYEFDSTVVVREYVELFLMPLLPDFESIGVTNQRFDYAATMPAAENYIGVIMNAITLCSVVEQKETWFDPLLRCCKQNLEYLLFHSNHKNDNDNRKGERMNLYTMEMKTNILSTYLIANRGLHRIERIGIMERIAPLIADMPSLHNVPKGVISPALQLQDGSRKMPSRIGLWAEIAVSMLLPDGNSHTHKMQESTGTGAQEVIVRRFLQSSTIQTLTKTRNDYEGKSVINPVDEMIYVLCSVAYTIGKQFLPILTTKDKSAKSEVSDEASSNNSSIDGENSNQEGQGRLLSWVHSEFESWLRSSLEILKTAMISFTWDDKPMSESPSGADIATTICFACQRSFIELLRVVLFASGLIHSNSSIFLHFICSVPYNPDHIQAEVMNTCLLSDITIENEISTLLDDALQILEQNDNKYSRRQRISIFALLSDVWIQRSRGIIDSIGSLQLNEKATSGPVDIDEDMPNINEQHIRRLLSQLAMEISKLIHEEKGRYTDKRYSTSEGEAFRFLLTCITSVESIGYISQLLINHFSQSQVNADNEESGKHIVSICTVVLKGQGKVEVEVDKDADNCIASARNRSDLYDPESPPRSPRTKARVTTFTIECSNAAKRLQNFVNYYNDKFDFVDKDHQIIDFNCFCPLFKLENYGLDDNDHTNDVWTTIDQLTLIHLENDTNSTLLEKSSPYRLNDEALLNTQQVFTCETYAFGYILKLQSLLLSHAVGKAMSLSPLRLTRNLEHPPTLPLKRRNSLSLGFLQSSSSWHRPSLRSRNTIYSLGSGSDPLVLTLSYSTRQLVRFDGEIEWAIVVTVVAYNVTAVPIRNGVKLDMTASCNTLNNDISYDTLWANKALITDSAIYKNVLEPGDHLVWEILLDSWPIDCELNVKYTLRELETENSSCTLLQFNSVITDTKRDEEDSASSNESEEGGDTLDISFSLEPVVVSDTITLQPNPFVFDLGEQVHDAFAFLWCSMSHSVPTLEITPTNPDFTSRKIGNVQSLSASRSSLILKYNGKTFYAWAFMTAYGKHILVISSSDINTDNGQLKLFVKGNDLKSLQFFVETHKQSFVWKLTSGNWCAE